MGIYYGNIVGILVSYYEYNSCELKTAKISVKSLEKYGKLDKNHRIESTNDEVVLNAAKIVIIQKLNLFNPIVISVDKLLKEEISSLEGFQKTGRNVWCEIGEF